MDHGIEKDYWQLGQFEQCYHVKQLKKVLSNDPVLKILKPEQIGLLQNPVSAYIAMSNQLEAILRKAIAERWINR